MSVGEGIRGVMSAVSGVTSAGEGIRDVMSAVSGITSAVSGITSAVSGVDDLTLVRVLRTYLEMNLLLGVGAVALWAGSRLEAWSGTRTHGLGWLRLSQLLFALALVLPLATGALPSRLLLEPAAQIWSGDRAGGLEHGRSGATVILPMARAGSAASGGISLAPRGLRLLVVFLIGGVAVGGVQHARQLRRLSRSMRALPLIRRIGRVRLVATDQDPVPFSAWLGRAWVAVPLELVGDAADFRIAVRHELQHHRQRDTLWVHGLELCRLVCFWNPALGWWSRLTTQFQELACDEALVGRQHLTPQAYGRCLVRTAQAALGARAVRVGTASMAAGTSSSFLRRRIGMMMDGEKRPSRRWVSMLIAIGTVAVLTTSAFASRSAVQDRTLDLKQAQAYAARVSSTVLPAAVDERVLEKLNALVGTPDGREHMKASLKRMPEFQPAFEAKLAEYGLPRELLAIPLIESGYKNLGPGSAERSDAPGPRGAGIWMFIPPTARKYGLRVDDQVDERLDPAKETEAAMKYLKQLHTEFGDWALAIAAYNMGEKAVRAVIDETGSRDAWQLSRDGKLNDYLATIMAGLIVLRNPEMVE